MQVSLPVLHRRLVSALPSIRSRLSDPVPLSDMTAWQRLAITVRFHSGRICSQHHDSYYFPLAAISPSLRDTLSESQEHIATTRIPPATSNNTFSSRPSLPPEYFIERKTPQDVFGLCSLCTAAPSAPARATHIHHPAFGKRSPRRLCCLLVSCDVHCTTSLSSLCLQYFTSCLAIFADAHIAFAAALCRCSTAHRVPPQLQPPRVLRASSPTTDIGPYKLLCRDCFSSVMKKNGDGHETRTAKV